MVDTLMMILGSPQVELGDLVGHEEDLPDAIPRGWSQGEGIAAEGLGQTPCLAHEVDAAAVLDLSHAIAGGVFDGRERRRIGARAGPVAAGGHGHVEGLVGPLEVVDMTPGREGLATVSEVAEATALEHWP